MNIIKKIIYQYYIPFIGRVYNRNRFINVIYYHDVVRELGHSYQQTNIEVFKKQMQYLVSHGYKTFRFDELNSKTMKYDTKSIIITFDDGWKSNYTEIYELMKSYGIKYNIFLTMGEVGVNPDYLTWEQIHQMHAEGMVGFGVHTYTHPDMSDISKIDTKLEFDKSDFIFEKQLGYRPLDFCYPYGKYSEESNTYILKHTSYCRIYTSRMMYSYKENDKMIFGRNGISNEDIFNVFKAKLKGYFNIWRTLIG